MNEKTYVLQGIANLMSLRRQKRDWDDLANLDPLWAILSHKNKKFRWDLNEFFSTGQTEIDEIIKIAEQLDYPRARGLALDFGCGVGRLTRAFAKSFQECYGVDISEIMITKAKILNQSIPNCKFILNTKNDLKVFQNNYFDLIYTNLVLQHLPDKKMIKSYLIEFVRILKKDGLLIFQLPHYYPMTYRVLIPVRRLAYIFLTSVGCNKKFIFEKLNLHPMRLNFIPEQEVIEFLETSRAKVLKIQINSYGGILNKSRTYFVTKDT
ncbi:MAG: hypothetical protein AUH25_04945 [Thaumarchaeota archaeon 13_1_40CM_38_12]|nr:MAG: hypothetical protein AUH25_04945 [Thaumarchaeota archaeon 13_1_40CM_38_12]OLD40719.1 MAG: hypothetical protein AUI60_03695 [Thaumarchaeota archaeon 13_1_40CM_2_39_4]